ncbi:MBL fold metallo-hydrolase [Candidatus Woesearchaeota archaeon]|nr:MBL fold metallo-hydrolase [Candidatus Woesearchaeota archaeon]
MKLKIIYDNTAKPGYKADWGFACFVEEAGILFDTGGKADILTYNMEKMGIKPEQIKKLVLSHDHWDHIGGLDAVLKKDLQVYVLSTFSKETKNFISQKAKLIEITESKEISKDVFTTGIISNSMDEQSLILKTGRGLVILTGCAHPGVDKIIEKASELGKIHAIIGGFHGFNKLEMLKGIEFLAACHCTEHLDGIKKMYPKTFRDISAGIVLKF